MDLDSDEPSWGIFWPGIQSMNDLDGERVTTSVALASETRIDEGLALSVQKEGRRCSVSHKRVERSKAKQRSVRKKKRER